ncbi:hypothetical protein H3H36_15615 [Duganella sp. FT3S]|uniref:Uncharacterized protein n=1 Tax=Rugamonas fusca TaxID=2758568 RepID=A0A7W2I7T3_9BURK|nr:hypothetical protein [Rugamonas fusca]MBA5606784.1 hypothetical protein [Rugamonas fusca]
MNSFESWMLQQGLSESSVRKYGNAIGGPLTAWANANSVLVGSLTGIEDVSKFQSISSAIQKLPIFLERNSTGHGMYSRALAKFAEYLQRERDAPISDVTLPSDGQIQVSEKDRISLANMMVDSLPRGNKKQLHDLAEDGFRIFLDGDQCAAVYFANNAPIHLIEFALDTKKTTIGAAERQAFIVWLEHQKAEFGGHDARNHKKGRQLDWFRIGVKTYGDAIAFIKRISDERRNLSTTNRWAIPTAILVTPASHPARTIQAISAVVANVPTDTWASTARRMVKTAQQTSAFSNGQVVPQTIKNKNNAFESEDEFVSYVKSLIEKQEGLCAISGLPLQSDIDGQVNDEMRASLDRINSDGHYEVGNLQVVCRFINRWKGSDQNSQFKELIHILREHWANH